MQLTLKGQLTRFTHLFQDELFPILEKEVGPLSEAAKRVVQVLGMTPLRRFVPVASGWNGRPSQDRYAIACAFVAKAVFNFATTRQLIERLTSDASLREICGWKRSQDLPHESTFSRAFAEFAAMELPQFVHQAVIAETQKDRLIGHISRDSTAIEARERFPETKKKADKPAIQEKKPRAKHQMKRKKTRVKPATRLQRQRSMKLPAMLEELPAECSIGSKTSSKGHQQYWRGYKLHLDVADGQIPISALLTGASVHDSQVAIPLATMTAQRVTSLYDLMDAAYDADEIHAHSRSLGHVPIINPAHRGRKTKNVLATGKPKRQLSEAEEQRFKERTTVERVNARIKDEFGGRHIRVSGPKKVMAHLMFGVLALTVDQLLRLAG
jgi:Transposase DDE domain/Transposase domain (DUF772)